MGGIWKRTDRHKIRANSAVISSKVKMLVLENESMALVRCLAGKQTGCIQGSLQGNQSIEAISKKVLE